MHCIHGYLIFIHVVVRGCYNGYPLFPMHCIHGYLIFNHVVVLNLMILYLLIGTLSANVLRWSYHRSIIGLYTARILLVYSLYIHRYINNAVIWHK